MNLRVLGVATPDCIDGGLLDVFGCIEVRFADPKVDGIPTHGLQLPGTLVQRADGGRLDVREAFGEVVHDGRVKPGLPSPLPYSNWAISR